MVGLLWLNSTTADTALLREEMTLLCDVTDLKRAVGYINVISEPIGCFGLTWPEEKKKREGGKETRRIKQPKDRTYTRGNQPKSKTLWRGGCGAEREPTCAWRARGQVWALPVKAQKGNPSDAPSRHAHTHTKTRGQVKLWWSSQESARAKRLNAWRRH